MMRVDAIHLDKTYFCHLIWICSILIPILNIIQHNIHSGENLCFCTHLRQVLSFTGGAGLNQISISQWMMTTLIRKCGRIDGWILDRRVEGFLPDSHCQSSLLITARDDDHVYAVRVGHGIVGTAHTGATFAVELNALWHRVESRTLLFHSVSLWRAKRILGVTCGR